MTEFTQINSNRAAILEEDDAPTPAKPNGKANGDTEVPCLFCAKNPRRQQKTDYCQQCWDAKQSGVKLQPIINADGTPVQRSEPGSLCAKCKKNPTRKDVPYCEACFKRFTPEAKLRYKRLNKPQCQECGENPVLEGEEVCLKCLHHGKTKMKPQASLEFDKACMYGWLGDYATKLGSPLSAAYPAALAVAAGYGVPSDRRVRTNLYVTILGKTRAGKSVTKDRAVDSWLRPPEAMSSVAYPGSEIGLVQILGGKRVKQGDDHDLTCKQALLVQDEMRLTFGKIAIQNSALPNALNEMFYKDVFETAAKGGFWVCDAKLSILGCLTCANPDEFADIYGVDTATGLYGRTIFGIVPSGWDFQFATWEPPTEPDGGPIMRRSKTCKVTAEAFRLADDWAKEDIAARADLKELALRVALITSSLNHDSEVKEDAMRCALKFMEWQQRIRAKYRPSEMDTPSGKCQQAIVRALERYEDWVPWRDLCRNHSLYKNKAWDATILNRVKRAMIFEGMLEEEVGEKNSEGKQEKTGRVRLAK